MTALAPASGHRTAAAFVIVPGLSSRYFSPLSPPGDRLFGRILSRRMRLSRLASSVFLGRMGLELEPDESHVADIAWISHLTDLFGWMTPGDSRTFPLDQKDEAIQSVRG